MERVDERLLETMRRFRRSDFLPLDQRDFSSVNRALSIGYGQTNSQPTTVLNMLTLLGVEPGQNVLDVGSGSGWTAALLADLVGPTGSVHGVELVPELMEWGAANLAKYDLPWASIAQAEPNVLGLPNRAPFDRILVSAEARRIPKSLVEQLRSGGSMVVPVSGWMTRVRRIGGETSVERHGSYVFVPLIEP